MELMALQFSYVLMGVAMNVMSLRHFMVNGNYYTPTRPVVGLATMVIYGMSVPLALLDCQWPFRIAMGVFVVILAGGGVVKHLATKSPDQYVSTGARWLAVAINSYGVILSAFALTVSVLGAGL